MKPLRVFIVDDNFVARRGLRSVLEAEAGIEIAGEASTGSEAVKKVKASGADIVLMDIRMPEMDGIKATLELVGTGCGTKVLILTVVDDPYMLASAINAGAGGYLVYGHFSPRNLVSAIIAAAAGETVNIPPLSGLLPDGLMAENGAPVKKPEALTPREKDVMQLIAAGYENREIAAMLAIEEKTVKNHINNIYSKLGVASRREAILKVLENRLKNR